MPRKKPRVPRTWSERAARAKWTHQRISQNAHAGLGRLSACWGVPVVQLVDWLVRAAEGVTMLLMSGELFLVYIGDKAVAAERAADEKKLLEVLRTTFLGQKLAGPLSVRRASDVPLEEFQRLILTNLYDHINTLLVSIAQANAAAAGAAGMARRS